MWHDGPVALKTCPVLAFSPDVESALRWFFWTHAIVVVPFVGARYERVAWPRAGGAGEQDAWLTEACNVIRLTLNAVIAEQTERAKARAPKAPKGPTRRGK